MKALLTYLMDKIVNATDLNLASLLRFYTTHKGNPDTQTLINKKSLSSLVDGLIDDLKELSRQIDKSINKEVLPSDLFNTRYPEG